MTLGYGDDAALPHLVKRITTELDEQLTARGSALLAAEEPAAQLHDQVGVVVSEALNELGFPIQPAPAAPSLGRTRALQGLHPAESVAAGETLFEVALPILAEWVTESGHRVDTAGVATALNRAISAQLLAGSLSYVDTLLERISAVQNEERARIARELHDRISHGIMGGLAHLSVAELPECPDPALQRVVAAELFTRAAADVRDMAGELRGEAADMPLDTAVARFLRAAAPASLWEVQRAGEVPRLRPAVGEQAFAVVREALRNALRHAHASWIVVSFTAEPGVLDIEVSDDGVGFDPLHLDAVSLGLVGMTERAELIHAEFAVESAPGKGTHVTMRIETDD